MVRHCELLRALDPREIDLIKVLHRDIGKNCPDSPLMALVDMSKPIGDFNCPHRVSWGFENYCSNHEHIRINLKK